jgi:hypothetical protein
VAGRLDHLRRPIVCPLISPLFRCEQNPALDRFHRQIGLFELSI